MATPGLKNSSLQPNLAAIRTSALNDHLLSSLQPTATAYPSSSALQAFLTTQSKNLNTSNNQGVSGNQWVVENALRQPQASAELAFLLNQGGLSNLHGDASRAASLLSLIKNHQLGNPLTSAAASAPNSTSPNSSQSPIQELVSLLQQVQWQQMLVGGQSHTYQAQTQQALIGIIQEQMHKNGIMGTLGSQQRIGSQGIKPGITPASMGQENDKGSDGVNQFGKKRSNDSLVSNVEKRARKEQSQQVLSPASQGGDDSLVLDQRPPKTPQSHLGGVKEVTDSDAFLADHLVKILMTDRDKDNTKNHFGLQALIREYISLALSRRSFGLLLKASELAVKFSIGMDTILSGVEKEGVGNESVKYSGGRMDYLLPMLLKSRTVQAHLTKECDMLAPNLPSSILSHIAPAQCSSFRNLNVQNRWIFIRETSMGNTKFYCSPMFEKYVLPWALISKLYEDNVADIFSIIFTDDQCDKVSKYLAGQISMHPVEDAIAHPTQELTQIRLLTNSLSRGEGVNGHSVIDVKMMLSSIQTMDSHLVSFPHLLLNQTFRSSSAAPHPLFPFIVLLRVLWHRRDKR